MKTNFAYTNKHLRKSDLDICHSIVVKVILLNVKVGGIWSYNSV